MRADAPNLAYYRSVQGHWSGPLDLRITDWRAFRACPMALLDRLGLLAMVATARLLGPFRLDTSVDAREGASRRQVIHTTRVSRWGLTLMQSVDTISLSDNGRDLTMRVELGVWPLLRHPRVGPESPAHVDASGCAADYRFPWFGTEMRQRGERNADATVVTLTQETAFSHGIQVLRRIAPAPPSPAAAAAAGLPRPDGPG